MAQGRTVNCGSDGRGGPPNTDHDNLDDYPYLKAGVEDSLFVNRIAAEDDCSRRHVVCAMHDALEFILYAVLEARGVDIYANGQNTIGFDQALQACSKNEIDIPLKSSVREIQKKRGDAKHHAQPPDLPAYNRMLADFQIVVSRLVHEQFGRALGSGLRHLDMLPYHSAQFSLYRRQRTHRWQDALMSAVAALLHKLRAIQCAADDFSPARSGNVLEVIKTLEVEARGSNSLVVSGQPTGYLQTLPGELRRLYNEGNCPEAADMAGSAYSALDEARPALFDMERAKRLTERLYQPERFLFEAAIGWSTCDLPAAPDGRSATTSLARLLDENLDFVTSLGTPFAEIGGSGLQWWEFAAFDGVGWHSFHLDRRYVIALEVGRFWGEGDEGRREAVANLVLAEFEKAIALFKANSS